MTVTRVDMCIIFFFFQAEDGIRDYKVRSSDVCSSDLGAGPRAAASQRAGPGSRLRLAVLPTGAARPWEIGRASCRGRVEISVVAVSLKKKNLKLWLGGYTL